MYIRHYETPNRYQFVTLRAQKVHRQRKLEQIKTTAGEVLTVLLMFTAIYLMMFI